MENLREEIDGLKTVFGAERSVGKLDAHGAGAQRTPNVPETDGSKEFSGNRENVSQLFWLLTSSTKTPRLLTSSIAPQLVTSSTETPSDAPMKTTTIHPTLSTSIRMMTVQDQTLKEIDLHGAHTTNRLLTTTGPFQSQTITTTIAALNPFSLPFLNNPRRPDKESLEDSSEEEKQLSKQGTEESSSLVATTKDMLEQSSFNIKEQSSFDIKVESEEKGKFGEEIEVTVPYVTTTSLPITNLQMSESEKTGRRKKFVFQYF